MSPTMDEIRNYVDKRIEEKIAHEFTFILEKFNVSLTEKFKE